MNTRSYTAVRANFSQTMQQVCEDHTPVIITRSKAEPVVLIALSDFEEMQETYYLLKSPANAQRLFGAIEEIEDLISKKKK